VDVARFYTSKELAGRLGYSVKWVEKWRSSIVGASKIGGEWRFDKAIVDARIAKGQDLRVSRNLAAPRCRKYILSVHGAARSGSKERKDSHGA